MPRTAIVVCTCVAVLWDVFVLRLLSGCIGRGCEKQWSNKTNTMEEHMSPSMQESGDTGGKESEKRVLRNSSHCRSE